MSKFTKLLNHPGAFVRDMAVLKKLGVARDVQSKVRVGRAQRHAGPVVRASGRAQYADIDAAADLFRYKNREPVNVIRYGDLRLWPALRCFLWVRLSHAAKGSAQVGRVNPYRYSVSPAWRKSYREDFGVGEIDELPEREVDFLFFTNVRGTEQTTLDGKIYNRITDPVFEAAREVGIASKVEVVRGVGPIHGKRAFPPHMVLPPATREIGHFSMLETPPNVVEAMAKAMPHAKVDRAALTDCVEWFFQARAMFRRILQRMNPRVVFFMGYDYYAPLTLAARELGISTVDLQHGVQGGWSPLYNHWEEAPVSGYDLLPDIFWVWGDNDARHIEETFPRRHRPVVGGFPWLRRSAPETDGDSIRQRYGIDESERVGVITLQDQLAFPSLFRDIVQSTRGQVRWLIRRHPKFQKIHLAGAAGAVIDSALEATPFRTLISQADLHLTECSTSVIEADYEGVLNFVSGKQGLANYRSAIRAGDVVHVDSSGQFLSALQRASHRPERPGSGMVSDVCPSEVVANLLEGGP